MAQRCITLSAVIVAIQIFSGCATPLPTPPPPITPTPPASPEVRGAPPSATNSENDPLLAPAPNLMPAVAAKDAAQTSAAPPSGPSTELPKPTDVEKPSDKKGSGPDKNDRKMDKIDTNKPSVLPAPPQEPGDVPLPINLAAALQLSNARPLIVAAAQAATNVAQAELDKAKVLWIPNLDIGADYYRHDGPGPDLINGEPIPPNKPLDQNINFLYAGGGLINSTETTDMIFQPLAARQVVNAREANVQTAKNDALLQTAEAYFKVHQYRGRYAGALDVVDRGKKLVERVLKLSEDLVPKVEVDRSKRLLEDLRQEAARSLEEYRVNSADLTLVLRLDPRAVVVPLEHDHLQLTLVDQARTLDELMPIALLNRPEIATQRALVEAARVRIRQEVWRPFIPTLYLNGFQTPGETIEGGIMGIGHDSNLDLFSLRDDLSPQITWEARNMGFGNMALRGIARAQQQQVLIELAKAQDKAVAEVTRALARIKSAYVRVEQADNALREAIITYDGNYEGLRQTTRLGNVLIQVYRPQEAVASLEHLKVAYDEFFDTVAEYNRAQFQMFHALGYPAQDIAKLRPPGEPSPVNTARPAFLPPVINGPPPPTR